VRRRSRIPLAVLAGAALATAASASQSSGATASAARAPTVTLEQTDAGKILADGSGSTLYMFTRDRRNHDSCAKVPGCLRTWPALTTTRRPVAGPGVRASLLGTIKFHGDRTQVTYAGHPLYSDSLDFGAGSTLNIGERQYGGSWYAVGVSGRSVY
jgi:predicted lipoprotein with Yx(FWY)xxD motif